MNNAADSSSKSTKVSKVAKSSQIKAPVQPKKPSKIRSALEAAIRNVSHFGDTDIFPFSFEQHVFRDRPELVLNALEEIDCNFESLLTRFPPDNINTLVPVGYTGFRWASQIDPLWNAYFLALVIEMGPAIEETRIPISEKSVFSYRFAQPNADGRIFTADVGWRDFIDTTYQIAEEAAKIASERAAERRALKKAADKSVATNTKKKVARKGTHKSTAEVLVDDSVESPYVIICDISEFYSRIYHHRVENALKWLDAKPEIVKKIVALLQVFSGTVSYGLPVGGPASRLLAEISLDSVDKLLRGEGIRFCRYVDDYRIFCNSKEEAYQRLILLSEKLFNEGLSLQKAKTRILTAKEYMDECKLLLRSHQVEDQKLTEEDKLLRIAIHFDPYSDSATDDYEKLKEQVSQVDIAGILARELDKTRIDTTVTKQAISALRVLEPARQKNILSSLLKPDNLNTLGPVFARLMTVLRGVYPELDFETQCIVETALIGLVEKGSHLIKIDLNLAYLVQVLRRRHSQPTETLFVKLFKLNTSSLVRREIILAWIEWRHKHSLTDLKKRFNALSRWERRAFIVGSYVLTDEGSHWRNHNKNSFDPGEFMVRDWASDRPSDKMEAHL